LTLAADLAGRFQGLFEAPAGEAFDRLARLYAEPQRRYHTLDHIADCLEQLDERPTDARLIEEALWWHDAIYDPTRSDNEARSADLARADLEALGLDDAERQEVARLILLTAGHRVDPADAVGARLVAIDLSILGREPPAYDRYAAAIRQEYAHVPEPLYRAGRARVLKGFLTGPIYADPEFAARYEAQARANLEREIEALTT
jgi:predicted metal-dependent HD superfamily phosphohydrolase